MCEKQCLWRVSVCHIIENLSERVSLCLYNTLRFPAKAWQIPTIFLYSLSSVSLLIKNHSGSPFLSYPITYSCSLLELLSFPSTRVSIVLEYSRSLRICSPLYLIIQDPQNMNNPPKNSIVSFLSNMIDAILGQRNWLVQKLNCSIPTILMHSAREGGKFTIWEKSFLSVLPDDEVEKAEGSKEK